MSKMKRRKKMRMMNVRIKKIFKKIMMKNQKMAMNQN
jgi:hypothetical protein